MNTVKYIAGYEFGGYICSCNFGYQLTMWT